MASQLDEGDSFVVDLADVDPARVEAAGPVDPAAPAFSLLKSGDRSRASDAFDPVRPYRGVADLATGGRPGLRLDAGRSVRSARAH
jgi:hypothetical protein